jgi:signal transduction histidine kinase
MMFTAASLRLAGWYVAILMGLSLAFSVWVYNEASAELHQGFEGPVRVWIGNNYGVEPDDTLQQVFEQQVTAGQKRVISRLFLLNLGVLVVGGVASYWLARRTLRPIEIALEAQNRFTADASHELRTPLAAMKTEIEVALRDPEIKVAEITKLLRSNLEEIDRMSSLAHNLLALARSDSKPHLSAVPISDVVEAVGKRLEPLAKVKKMVIKYEILPVKVMANVKQLDTILGILLDNAIKYSPDNTFVTIKTVLNGGHCLISVCDKGYGIAANDLAHIFERFYRADSSRSKQHVTGHGLGLSIAMKLAAGLHATLSVSSKLGKGSIFTLRVALAQ